MARRKRGLPIDGWLIIDKPQGVGSTQVVAKARWALRAQKAGHAGTLDPMATGLLAIAFGEATKTVPHAMDALKCYRFTIRWGEARDTDDADGAVIAASESRPTAAAIKAALPAFRGDILQRPPNFSAVHVDGQRAYDLAREGVALTLEPRPIYVDELNLVSTPDADTAVVDMVCGAGGYVRAIARDLGETLGCLGHVVALRRLWAGPFTLDDAISFEKLDALRDSDAAEEVLLPVSAGLDDIPALEVDGGAAAQLRQGRSVGLVGAILSQDLAYGETAWASYDGKPVALGQVKAGAFHPTRVFNLLDQGPDDVDNR